MARIVEINEKEVLIGEEDGSLISVDPFSFNFVPKIGQKVLVFRSEDGKIRVVEDNVSADSGGEMYEHYRSTNRPVNRTTYMLLAFFCGGLGVHKFYAGFVGRGLVYFFFSWTFIPSIFAFCTFIQAAMTTPDSNGNIYLSSTSSIIK